MPTKILDREEILKVATNVKLNIAKIHAVVGSQESSKDFKHKLFANLPHNCTVQFFADSSPEGESLINKYASTTVPFAVCMNKENEIIDVLNKEGNCLWMN
jgi:hypothetical protein